MRRPLRDPDVRADPVGSARQRSPIGRETLPAPDPDPASRRFGGRPDRTGDDDQDRPVTRRLDRTEAPSTADTGRPARVLLRDPVFGPYFVGKLVSTVGVWVHNIAAAIVVWELTRSALLVGAVSVGQFLPQLLLTPWSGARADRADRRRQIIVGRLVTAAGSLGLVLWSVTIGLEGIAGATAVITAATVVGIGFALGGPAMQSLIPALVRPSELPTAIALSSVPFTVARASGPAIGALLVATTGPTVAFGVAAATNLLFALLIHRLPIKLDPRPVAGDGRIRAGVRYVREQRGLLALLIGVAAVGVGADPVITLTPSIAERLGMTSSFVGVQASAFGIGAGLAFLLLARARLWLGLPRLGTAGLSMLAFGLAMLAVAPAPAVAITALLIGGAGMSFALTSMTTLVQQQVPDELRGRVMALWSVAFLGSRPITAGITGAVADATSVVVALSLVVLMLAGGAVVARPSRVSRTAPILATRPR
jgi:MFS family permease